MQPSIQSRLVAVAGATALFCVLAGVAQAVEPPSTKGSKAVRNKPPISVPTISDRARANRQQRPSARRASGGNTVSGGPQSLVSPPLALTASVSTGATVALGQSGVFALKLTSADQPTVYRIANSKKALQTTAWKALEPYPAFAPNGLFPSQIVVQVGKPLGTASHPVNGPHRMSNPVIVDHPSIPRLAPEPTVRSWNTQHGGNYTYVDGNLNIALNGLGNDTENIHISELSVCANSFRFSQPPAITRDVAGVFVLSGPGRFLQHRSDCRIQAQIVGDGGNFDTGIAYAYDRTDAAFAIARRPELSVSKTAAFAYGPKFNPHLSGAGNCTVGTNNAGKLYFEVTSGVLTASCGFLASELLVPESMTLKGLYWKVEEYRATSDSQFHCGVSTSYPSDETRYWYKVVSPTKHDYFYDTDGANPILPGDVAPQVNADLSTAKPRQWVVPLKARLGCSVFVAQGPGGALRYDRLRLVLDRIDYFAPPTLPVGTQVD